MDEAIRLVTIDSTGINNLTGTGVEAGCAVTTSSPLLERSWKTISPSLSPHPPPCVPHHSGDTFQSPSSSRGRAARPASCRRAPTLRSLVQEKGESTAHQQR